MEKENNLKISDEELQSKIISFLRFPLIVGVVLIHTTFSDLIIGGEKQIESIDYPVYSCVSYFFSQIFARISVPLFFFISGFLFFFKTGSFGKDIYLQKLKKRIRSIFIPYIFWNLLIILFSFLSQVFFTEMISGRNKLICNYNIIDWLKAFWNMSMGYMPINFPLWFIRDLMIVICLSPLIYFFVKKLRLYGVICLGILWIFDCWFSIIGFSSIAFFWFSAGAYFSIFNKKIIGTINPRLFILLLLYMLIVMTEFYFPEESWTVYVHNIGLLVGIIVVISLSTYFVKKGAWRVSPLLDNSSFFIYAFHAMPLAFVIKLLFKFIRPHTESSLLGLYVICPIITVLISLFFYCILKKYLPSFTAIITGGR